MALPRFWLVSLDSRCFLRGPRFLWQLNPAAGTWSTSFPCASLRAL